MRRWADEAVGGEAAQWGGPRGGGRGSGSGSAARPETQTKHRPAHHSNSSLPHAVRLYCDPLPSSGVHAARSASEENSSRQTRLHPAGQAASSGAGAGLGLGVGFGLGDGLGFGGGFGGAATHVPGAPGTPGLADLQ
jgi:hypothetical protein